MERELRRLALLSLYRCTCQNEAGETNRFCIEGETLVSAAAMASVAAYVEHDKSALVSIEFVRRIDPRG